MPEATTIDRTAFVTFYSFKGGVGRSMALINVAGIMAGRGFKVMALDMDLEAPGISYLMRHESKQGDAALPGFVDLLSDACQRGEEADLFALEPSEVIERYSYLYQIPAEINRSEEGCLRIMPAGQFDGHYQESLNDLNLGQLYLDGQGQPLIAAFKKVIADAACFDFVFIDSRTGFSDESGICTRDLADYLVVVMGLNRQNQEGTAEFLRSLKESDATPKGMRIVLSPVPNGEDELLEKCEKQAAEILSQAWGTRLDLSLQIPYHPRLALTEEPHIFRRSRGYLYEAYASIEREVLALMGLSPDKIREQISENAEKKAVADVLRSVKTLTKLDNGPELLAGVAITLVDLLNEPDAQNLSHFLAATVPAESWSMKQLASELYAKANPIAELFYKRLIEATPNDPSAYNNLGNVYQEKLHRPQEAERAYLKSIELNPKYALPYSNLGNLYLREQRPLDAEIAYLKAIELDSSFAPPHNGLGRLYQDNFNRPKDAETAYHKAIEINPRFALPYYNLGTLYREKLDRPQDSERAFLKAIKLDPKSAYPYWSLGLLYHRVLDRPQDAEQAYLKAIEADPKFVSAHSSLADLYQFQLARPQDAEREWRNTLQLNPRQVTALQGLVFLYVTNFVDFDRAQEELKKCLEEAPDTFGTQFCICALQLWEEGWDRASQKFPSVLTAAAEKDPDNWKGELRVFIRKVRELGNMSEIASQLASAAANEQPWWQPWAEAVAVLCEENTPIDQLSPQAEKVFKFLTS